MRDQRSSVCGTAVYHNRFDVDGGDGTVGFRWNQSLGYDVKLDLSCCGDKVVRFDAPSGYHVTFRDKHATSGVHQDTPSGLSMTLTKKTDGTFELVANQSREKMKFSTTGQLTRTEDRNANGLNFTYGGPGGRLTKITDTRGRDVTFSYMTNGDPDKMTDWSGRVWDYTVQNASLTSYRNPDGKDTTYGDNAGGRLSSITDGRGNQITIGEESLNRVTSVTRVTPSTLDVDPQSTFDYKATVTAPCNTTDASKEHVGMTVETDPRGKLTTYCYDRQLRVKSVIDDDGHERSTSWNVNSDVVDFTDGTGTASSTATMRRTAPTTSPTSPARPASPARWTTPTPPTSTSRRDSRTRRAPRRATATTPTATRPRSRTATSTRPPTRRSTSTTTTPPRAPTAGSSRSRTATTTPPPTPTRRAPSCRRSRHPARSAPRR